MKKLLMVIPLGFLLCLTFACQDKEAMTELETMKAQTEVEEQNIALIKRQYDAWNSGEVEAFKEVFSPDYVYHSSSGDQSLEQNIELLEPQMVGFPDRAFSVEDMLAKGDKVVSRIMFKGTHEGEFQGIPATEKKVEVNGIEIWRVENGKIVESWAVGDSLSLFKQLGMELKPKEGEK